ncbi:MAG: hypothetical protein SCH98_10950 [Deferrisomatales bacterium]|nr:hypothetical protein [Deferrisomatales bacterium]
MLRCVRMTAVVVLALILAPVAVWAQTIAPGETRVVHGKIAAVDVAQRAVVVNAPLAAGDLIVGVTLGEGVEPQLAGKAVSLGEVAVGDRAVLQYTREDGKLVGQSLTLRR